MQGHFGLQGHAGLEREQLRRMLPFYVVPGLSVWHLVCSYLQQNKIKAVPTLLCIGSDLSHHHIETSDIIENILMVFDFGSS